MDVLSWLTAGLFFTCEVIGVVIMARRFRGTTTGLIGIVGFSLLCLFRVLQFSTMANAPDEWLNYRTLIVGGRVLAWSLILVAILEAPSLGPKHSPEAEE